MASSGTTNSRRVAAQSEPATSACLAPTTPPRELRSTTSTEAVKFVLAEMIPFIAQHLQSMQSLRALSVACKLFRGFMYDEQLLMLALTGHNLCRLSNNHRDGVIRHFPQHALAITFRVSLRDAEHCSSAAHILEMSINKHSSFDPGTGENNQGSYVDKMRFLRKEQDERIRAYCYCIRVLFEGEQITPSERKTLKNNAILQQYLATGELLEHRDPHKDTAQWAGEDKVRKCLRTRFRNSTSTGCEPLGVQQLVYNALARGALRDPIVCNWESLCSTDETGAYLYPTTEAINLLGLGGTASPFKISMLFTPVQGAAADPTSYRIRNIRAPRHVPGCKILRTILAAMNSFGRELAGLEPRELLMDDLESASTVLTDARNNFYDHRRFVEKMLDQYSDTVFDTVWWGSTEGLMQDTSPGGMFPAFEAEKFYEMANQGSWWKLFPHRELNAGQKDLVQSIWNRVYQEQLWCNPQRI